MEEILQRSAENNEQMSAKVAALLAGSALTTKGSVSINKREIQQVDYTAVGKNILKPVSHSGLYLFVCFIGDDPKQMRERYKPRRRGTVSEDRGHVSLHQATSDDLEARAAAAGIKVQRRKPSVTRKSLARMRRHTEFVRPNPAGLHVPGEGDQDGLDADDLDEKRIIGLRRAKVPLMVYSCGGFTRCFRIARRYQVDGPPIGVTYDQETRKALNPELNI